MYNPALVSRHALILVLAAGLTFFLGLGRGAIGDSDEAFYAEAAREMVESDNWLTPYYNYELRFQKPILYYWLSATAYEFTGINEAAARVPSALTGLGLVLITWLVARRWCGAQAGLLAGLIAATNFGYYFMARMALPDLPLAFLITLASWAGLESLDAGRHGQGRESRLWLLLAAVAAALGVLMKGPVGLALPVLVVCGALLVPRPTRGARWPWRLSDLAVALATFVLVAAPWYLAMAREHGVGYLHHFFVGENVDRFATDRYNDPRPIWFYLPIVLGGLLPWSPFMAPWVRTGWKVVRRVRPLSRPEIWLLLWAGIPLLFYSLSIGKQPRYVLPVLPPLAVLLGRSIAWRVASVGDRGHQRTLRWCGVAVAAILLLLGALLHHAKPLLFALAPRTGAIATVVIFAAGLAVLALAWSRRSTWLPLGIAAASAATLVSTHYSVYSAEGIEPVQRMAAVFRTHWPDAAESGTYRVFVRNLVFYTGVKQTDLTTLEDLRDFLAKDERVLVVSTEEDLQKLADTYDVVPRRLERVTYFNPAGVRVRTLLAPDPEKDLETVWLVSNR